MALINSLGGQKGFEFHPIFLLHVSALAREDLRRPYYEILQLPDRYQELSLLAANKIHELFDYLIMGMCRFGLLVDVECPQDQSIKLNV